MELPVNVSEKIKAFLGSDGVVHRIPEGNAWVDTNCLEWKFPALDLEIPKFSQSLADSLEKISRQISNENLYTKAGYLNEKRYASRFKEAFEQEASSELQDELNGLRPKLMELNNKQEDGHRKRRNTLKKVRALLKHDPVIAYWGGTWWEGSIPDVVVIAPITDQFEILKIEQTSGVNYGVLNDDVVSRMQTLDAKYGIDIMGASPDSVDFKLKRIPKSEHAKELGKWLLEFCPDLYEAPRSFPNGKVSLWWD